MNKAFFKTRYDALHQAGVAKLMAGDIATFGGVTEAMKQDLVVAVMFRQNGVRFSSLLAKLYELESVGYSLFLAHRDFPAHASVQVATGGLEAEGVLLEHCGHVPFPLSFDRVVLDPGGNVVLMNEGVPREIAEWRGWASQIITEYGGQPKPLPILHSTLARIKSPKTPSPEASARLVALVEDWNNRLREEPLLLVSSRTFVGSVYDLLTM